MLRGTFLWPILIALLTGLAAGLAAGLLTGCGTGMVGETLRGEAPTAKEALGEPAADIDCKSVGNTRPLIVDWSSQSRLDLELAMKQGVAVVHYGCDGFRLLPQCSLTGAYNFVGVSRKEDVIQLNSADELAANLPLSAVKLSAEVSGEQSLDLALVMVGKRTTTVSQASRLMLDGQCEGATHFVRAATIGAFAMDRGSAGKARAVADLFGAGVKGRSESRSRRGSKDGDLLACRKAQSRDEGPPDQCQAAMRLDLTPLTKGLLKAEAEGKRRLIAGEKTCPAGLVQTEGKCTKPKQGQVHQCRTYDVAECTAMCDAGNMASCGHLAGLYWLGRGVESDTDQATALALKACRGGHHDSCVGYTWLKARCLEDREKRRRDDPDAPRLDCGVEPLDLLKKACDAGHGGSCETAAELTVLTPATQSYRERACKLGQGDSCVALGSAYLDGDRGVAKDTRRGLELLTLGCDGGSTYSCARLAKRYREGNDGVPKDLLKAVQLEERICAQDGPEYCVSAGKAYEKAPPGVSRDLARAERLYRAGCMSKNRYREEVGQACARLGSLLRRQDMTDEQEREMLAAMADGCTIAGIGCPQLRRRLEQRTYAKKKDACLDGDADACDWLGLEISVRGCQRDDVRACQQLRQDDEGRYWRLQRDRCVEGKADACEALTAAGRPDPRAKPKSP